MILLDLQLKARIVQLERALEDERKKSEDLQFSIDEATFCGDELNAQTHVYKEKIHDLERKLVELTSGTPSLQASAIQDNSATITTGTEVLNAKINELTNQVQQQVKEYEAHISAAQDEEQRLHENIQYLQTENETLQKELFEKDANLEKFSLSESGIDNLRKELVMLKEENEKERQQAELDFRVKFEEKEAELKELKEELAKQKNLMVTLESERSNVEDECEILRVECKTRDSQLQELNEQLAKLKAELSMQKAENATLDELLKTQQQGNVEGKTVLEEKIEEIGKLKQEIVVLKNTKGLLENNVQTTSAELKKLSELQSNFEQKLQEATSADQEKRTAMMKLELVIEELKKRVNETSIENEQLKTELKQMQQAIEKITASEHTLRQQLEQKEKALATILADHQQTKELSSKYETELTVLKQQSTQLLEEKMKRIEQLNVQIGELQSRTAKIEGESSATVQHMSARVDELETEVKNLQNTLKQKEENLTQQSEALGEKDYLLAEQAINLNTSTTALESIKSVLDKLRQEHAQTVNKCATFEEQLKQSEVASAQQQLNLGDLTRKWEALSKKCDGLQEQNETLEQDLIAARNSRTELQAEMRKLSEDLDARKKSFAELQNISNDQRHKLESQIEELNQKLTNTAADYETLKEAAQKMKDELVRKQQQIISLEEKTIKQELTLSDTQRQQANLQTKYDALTTQNASLQNDLTILRTTSTDSNAELLKLSQDVATKQKAYDDLLDKSSVERASLEGQLQASQQRIDSLCSQVETLTQELKISTEESFKRYELLKQEQEKFGKQELELGDLMRKSEVLNTKYVSLETENVSLQADLETVRATSTDLYAEVLRLTEELSKKQHTLQDYADESNAKCLELDSQLQELQQKLQSSQTEVEQLRNELNLAAETKTIQATEFESLKAQLQKDEANKLQELEDKAESERKELLNMFEIQLKTAEQTKITLDEAISSLQNQIKLLQDELLKSQLDFKTKEEDLCQQVATLSGEAERLRLTLQQVQSEDSHTLNNVQKEKSELLHNIETLAAEVKKRDQQLLVSKTEVEQLKLMQANTNADASKLQEHACKLQAALEVAQNELEYKTKLAEEDKNKMYELRGMLDTVQTVNANISATNAQLSDALQLLEQEKCETANIFELFEMESDQNTAKLLEKLSEMKQQIVSTQQQLQDKDKVFAEQHQTLENVSAKLEASQSVLAGVQLTVLEQTTKLNDLSKTNAELKKTIEEKEAAIQQRIDVEAQLAEYKKVIDELDDSAREKCTQMEQLQEHIKQLEYEKLNAAETQKTLKLDCAGLQRKLEVMDLEKTREIVALQARINELQSISKLKPPNGAAAGGDASTTLNDENDGSVAQINFLNSIIADMQKKNDTLKAKIEALEALPTDYMQPNIFERLTKRKPAPRVFCDICDEFDKHETEDCPLQASDDRDLSPPPSEHKKERKIPEPRKYCESCEVFGHETGECADDECY